MFNQILSALWGCFFAWMPLSLQIIFGAFVAIALVLMVVKVIGLILNAVPFL